jgi:glutathione synthase/RimK-type ligase-like ATP-grasp enzyme
MLLCIKPTLGSAKKIALVMEEKLGRHVPISTDFTRIKEVLIRYGNIGGPSTTQYNTKEFINLCSDKFRFSKLMEEHDIYSPRYFSNPEDVIFPAVIRQSLTSTGARGIIICEDRAKFDENWKPGYYWTPFIETIEYELRVHVLGGEIKRIFKKVDREEQKFPIRNNDSCHYSLKNISTYPKLQKVVNDMASFLGKENFYSMDIGWDKAGKDYFLFEINSAPGLNEHTAAIYAEFFIEKLKLT